MFILISIKPRLRIQVLLSAPDHIVLVAEEAVVHFLQWDFGIMGLSKSQSSKVPFSFFAIYAISFFYPLAPSNPYSYQFFERIAIYGVSDTNQAIGCLWWGERRQWRVLCRQATSVSAICRTRALVVRYVFLICSLIFTGPIP